MNKYHLYSFERVYSFVLVLFVEKSMFSSKEISWYLYQKSIVSVDYIGDPECTETCFSLAIFNALPSLWAINSSRCAPMGVSEFNLPSVHWDSQAYFNTFPKGWNIFRHNFFKSSFCIFYLCFVILQQEHSKIQRWSNK